MALATVLACGSDDGGGDAGMAETGTLDAGFDFGTLDADVDTSQADSGRPPDAGSSIDAAPDSSEPDGGIGSILAAIPNLTICRPATDTWSRRTEGADSPTWFHACVDVCTDWTECTREVEARGARQLELDFVVDEDGSGNGFGGTLRFTASGARDRVVFFHAGGPGNDWVDDFLPGRVEAAGGTYVQPKWVDDGTGWFARPHADSRLSHDLFGVSARVAAVMKFVYLEVARGPLATVGCSGGSIATYYPRHWYGLDPILRYQLLVGGPVMSRIDAGCSGGASRLGRCTLQPERECDADVECDPGGGTCSTYEWGDGVVMTAVRATIDQLHADTIGAANDCRARRPQPAFQVSDFDSALHPFDSFNEHRMDFVVNIGGETFADDVINVVASGAAVYGALTGEKSWNPQTSGRHCLALTTESAWDLLSGGAGLD